jgi:hypothetical protein
LESDFGRKLGCALLIAYVSSKENLELFKLGGGLEVKLDDAVSLDLSHAKKFKKIAQDEFDSDSSIMLKIDILKLISNE